MVEANNPANSSLGSPPVTQGSRIEHAYTVRKMRELPLYEHELDQLSLLNSLTSAFLSASSGSFLFALGLFTNAKIQGTLSAETIGFLTMGIPVGAVLGVGFGAAAVWAWRNKESKLNEIKKFAVDIEQSPQPPFPPIEQPAPSMPDMAETPPQ